MGDIGWAAITTPEVLVLLYSITIIPYNYSMCCMCVCFVCVFFPFILDIKFVGRTSRGHTGFLIHLLSAVRALIFLARRIQPFLSLVDREVEFCLRFNRSPLVGDFISFLLFFREKNPVWRDQTRVPTCQKVTRLTLSYRGDWHGHTYIKSMDQPGKVANPARGPAEQGKIIRSISLSAFVPENLVSRDGFGSPVPRQPAHLHTLCSIVVVVRFDILAGFTSVS